ncbi:hypothetical protein FEAC_14060 [Ferrimicrobium acidiphilum DSM 19497]|uniref:Uncharacterized protein n=2 Tax=Ferrimicrobium acidiphilum TaxID=121039 RepID=A0A0D8FVC5_9ACTN|nr:hypothetical protein FEAC_14060 [Ferrimicrobium acidiphilum DSM 19497]
MPVAPTWFDRDLPVLEAVIELFEERGLAGFTGAQVAERCGKEPNDVFVALSALKDEYVFLETTLPGLTADSQWITGVTALARQAVGQWPSLDTYADRFMAALQQAAYHESDPAKQSKIRSAADSVAGIGRDILVTVLSNVLSGAIGRL